MRQLILAWPRLENCRKLSKPVTFPLFLVIFASFYILANYSRTQDFNLTHEGETMLKLTKCGCQKYVKRVRPPDSNLTPVNGTCSFDSFERGAGQKVIGFTFYEPIKEENGTEDKHDRNYLKGIQQNLNLMKEKYGSDWVMRLYYQVDEESPVMKKLCDLACSEANLDLCPAEENPRLGNATILYPLIWRFLPVIDINVDLYLSRDLDSRINDREVILWHILCSINN